MKISLEDGKYEVTYEGGRITAARYDQPWRDLTGDKLAAWLIGLSY